METAIQQTITGTGFNVSGSLTFGSVTFGDTYNVNNAPVVDESHFHEPSLTLFEPVTWVDPPAARHILQVLSEHRLVILAGDLEDKPDCARHIALLFRQQMTTLEAKLRVLERHQGNEPQRIEPALQGEDPALLLLVDVTPAQLTVDSPGKLRRVLGLHGGYAIVTTDCGRSEWGLEGETFEARLWFDLSWKKYYGRELLVEFLQRQLDSLPEGLLPEPSAERVLGEGLPLPAVVEHLRSPAQVNDFAQALVRLDDRSPASIQQLAMSLGGDDQAIRSWYRRFDPRDQLLVLGLTLFDGLPEEMLFAGLELLVETIWRDADPLLPQFDYRDLPRLSAYFKPSMSEGRLRIECTSHEVRERILRVIWNDQRRRLLAALPALTALIRRSVADAVLGRTRPESVEPGAADSPSKVSAKEQSDLRFSTGETHLLHTALVKSLSLIGRLSFEVVEPYFLDLATDSSPSVRQLATRALSTWRDQGHEEQLFSRLRTWWAVACDYDYEDPRLERIDRPGEDPRASMRSAVALVVGHAARFDRPNRLAPQLHELLQALVGDKAPAVRAALESSTLPGVVAWHFRQVEGLLRTKVLTSDAVIAPVAKGAAEACWMRPEESLAILDGWRMAAKADRRPTSPLVRDRLLATVALTLGYIRCDPTRDILSPEAIGSRLRSMLAEETNPYVRQLTFFAIELQAVRNFELVSLILQDLLSRISIGDRAAAVEVFVRTYLHQRQRLPGGDFQIEIGGGSYGIWLAAVRPLTKIEALLYSWVLDDTRAVAQQLAVDVFEAMAETAVERAEARLHDARAAQRQTAAPPLNSTGANPGRQVHALPLLGRLAVFLAAPRKKRVRELLRAPLAELVVVRNRVTAPRTSLTSESLRPSTPLKGDLRTEGLLKRWSAVSNDATKAVARHLQRALALYRWRWGIVAGALVLVLAIVWGSWRLYQHVSQSRSQSVATQAKEPRSRASSPVAPVGEDHD
jgi:hypothetical protein